MKKIKKEYIVFLIILVIVTPCSFYGGMKYQEVITNSKMSQMRGQIGQTQNWQKQGTQAQGNTDTNRRGGGLIGGEVLSINDKNIVLKDRSGGSKIVFFSDSTQYLKSISGTLADISVGANITVTGSQNSDGSVTAKSIQIAPQIQPSK
ncbi:DUF5666 domain-containing protein [bacterium]|nr:DUF5666 domain-containing protein [bacterium]